MNEPTLVISGRATPKDICMAARFFRDAGSPPGSRSELVDQVFRLAAKMAEIDGNSAPGTNEEAILELQQMGIVWNSGARDIQKVLQFDVLADLTYEDALAMKQQILDMRKKGKDLMPSITSLDEEENNLGDDILSELEELDKELREEGDD